MHLSTLHDVVNRRSTCCHSCVKNSLTVWWNLMDFISQMMIKYLVNHKICSFVGCCFNTSRNWYCKFIFLYCFVRQIYCFHLLVMFFTFVTDHMVHWIIRIMTVTMINFFRCSGCINTVFSSCTSNESDAITKGL